MLAGAPAAFVNADVALDGEPVIGSFTVDGLTFAVTKGSSVELVGVSEGSSVKLVGVAEAEGAFGSEVPTSPQPPSASTPEAEGLASGADGSTLALPGSVTYGDAEYVVASIGAYAFYLSGVTSVELPASVADIDERAFRSSDVSSVEVAEGNPAYSSFDGVLYDVGQSSLLLIPEGRLGAVRMPSTVMAALPSAFSHCAGVDAITVDADGAAFASENGLLYDASLETLLRVPAGATDITIREGCTTIAAGAMEGCAKLSTITAPASVTSISPDVFMSVPTVSLPVASVADDAEEPSQAEKGEEADGAEGEAGTSPSTEAANSASTQLTALVALSSTDDDLPEVDALLITVNLIEGTDARAWRRLGVNLAFESLARTQSSATSRANNVTFYQVGYPQQIQLRLSAMGTGASRYAHTPLTLGPSPGGKRWGDYIQLQYSAGGHDDVHPVPPTGYHVEGLYYNAACTQAIPNGTGVVGALSTVYFKIEPNAYRVELDPNGGTVVPETVMGTYDQDLLLPTPDKGASYRFLGWDTSPDGTGIRFEAGNARNIAANNGEVVTLYAQWECLDFDVSFDVDLEPGDKDYPGIEKPDEVVNINDGPTVIEDPKRPGYMFQGWTIPNTEGTEAIDQDLVYQDETDGKWYVDASKLPDYATDGRVELTARWTSVISVDVPSAVTFYADVVTEGQESREGAASSAFGQNKVASQSEVDLRIVGLESEQVRGDGSTALGASDILKKAAGATPSSSAQKLLSLYPTSKALTPDDLQDPDAVSAAKPADAVDFALDDLLLEKSFAADKFTIPAGDTLNLGYRLNLSETGTELDYDKLSTLDEGQSASIATISYCFAANYDSPADWGEPLWIENPDTSEGAPRFLVLDDIKAAAEDLSAKGEASPYFATYDALMRAVTSEMVTDPAYDANSQRFFQLRVGGSYVPVQVIGICDDVTAGGEKAGLTFQLKNACRASGPFYPNTNSTTYGWYDGVHPNLIREWLRGDYWDMLPSAMRDAIVEVVKYQQVYEEGGTNTLPATTKGLQGPTIDTLFLPSNYEIFGDAFLKPGGGSDTVLFDRYGSEALTGVAGYTPTRYDWYATKQRIGELTLDDISRTWQGELRSWWTRSAHRTGAAKNAFLSVYYGTATANYGSSNAGYGVVPCFAL